MAIRVRATVSPTEDLHKVAAATRNLLGDCAYELEERADCVTASSQDGGCLQKIHDQLRDRHVRAAARRLFLRGVNRSGLTVLLNRQAAYAGVVALCADESESPLGPIVVEIRSDRPQELIEWLTAIPGPAPQG